MTLGDCEHAGSQFFGTWKAAVKLKIAGITAEYNPLHNGHVFHIGETRAQTGCGCLVVAMSGDFVQRGEPAILDKWSRAEHALLAGADLVVEIPTLFCLGNAAQYASASVCILESLGCSEISFGSESGDADILEKVAAFMMRNEEAIGEFISSKIKEGKSYPAARYEAYEMLRSGNADRESLGKELAVLINPNDILALESIFHMKNTRPLVIKRQGSYHTGKRMKPAPYKSAEYLRKVISAGGTGSNTLYKEVPGFVFDAFDKKSPVLPDNCFKLLKYAVLSKSAEAIDDCPSGGEGLGNLMKSVIKDSNSFDELVTGVKSKRYTYTRISRLCMQVLLGISRESYHLDRPGYIRVLGHKEKGRELLANLRNSSNSAEGDQSILPVITNINKELDKLNEIAADQLTLDIHAGDIYSLISGATGPESAEQRIKPIML